MFTCSTGDQSERQSEPEGPGKCKNKTKQASKQEKTLEGLTHGYTENVEQTLCEQKAMYSRHILQLNKVTRCKWK